MAKPQKQEQTGVKPQAIQQDAYDRLVYGQAVQDLPDLKALDRRSAQADSVLRDVHASLYKIRPVLDEESTAQHRDVLKALMETTEYAKLRATTRMSEVGAAFGTLELGRTLAEHLPEDQQDGEQQDGQDGQQDGQGDPAGAGTPGPGAPGQHTLKGCDGDPDAQRRLLRKIVAQAQERTEESVEAVEALSGQGGGWSPVGEGTDETMSLADAVALSKRLRNDSTLKRIVDLAGRMRRLASGKRETRLRHGPDDVVDVECGDNLARLLPSEVIALCTEELEWDALMRYAQKRMLQTQREGTEKADKGPIVVLVDESGSMQGDKNEWAKALALGVMSIARREKREFACGTFTTSVDLSSWGKRPSMDAVLAFLSRAPRGGTSFVAPLDAAMKLIEEAKTREGNGDWTKADIIFITDGDARVTEEWKQGFAGRAKATGAHLYTIYVGERSHTLDSIADGSAFVFNLNNDAEAIDLAFGI